jgi:hypothetical protein
MVLGGEQAALDRQLTHGNLKNLVVRYLFHHRRSFVIVVVMGVATACMIMFVSRAHWRPSCPYRSDCR